MARMRIDLQLLVHPSKTFVPKEEGSRKKLLPSNTNKLILQKPILTLAVYGKNHKLIHDTYVNTPR